ncbi:MAG: LysR family transcriptional regulator [Pseudomonadota bacterium]
MSQKTFARLPLLEAFDAIMTRGSIVAAAEAMGVTQSAVSKQLKQLREWLDDDLFVRTGSGMQPTPRALALREPVATILAQASGLAAEGRLEPSEFTGQFVISATDEILQRLVPDLVRRLATDAPRLRLITMPITRDYSIRELQSGQINLLVAVNWHAPEQLKQKRLGSDHFVCLMHAENPLAQGQLTLDRYAKATHVLVAPLGSEKGVVDDELERLGLRRHVCVSVPAFGLINEAVLGTSRISTLPSRVAADLAAEGPFRVREVPLKLQPTDYYALWHPRFTAEPRMRWFLERITETFDTG